MLFRREVGLFPCSFLLLATLACGTMPLPFALTSSNLSTLGATITSGSSEADGDDILRPAGIEETPVLSFEAGRGFCCDLLAIEFRVASSYPVAFAPSSYRWDFGDGRTGTGVSVQHTYPWWGDYLVTLTLTTSDDVVIEVAQTLVLGRPAPENGGIALVPIVDPISAENTAGSDQPGALQLTVDAGSAVPAFPGDEVILNGTANTSGETVQLAFQWRQLAGPTVSMPDPSRASTSVSIPSNILTPTELLFELTVTGAEMTASDRVTIVVSTRPNLYDVSADAGGDQTVSGDSVVNLDGSFSTGTGEQPLTFHWSQSVGPTIILSDASSPVPSFVAPEASSTSIQLIFRLAVQQGDASDADDVVVTIEASSPDSQPDEAQILAWMTELPPLPKVHFSWDYPKARLFTPIEDILFEYVRITHAISIRGETARQIQVDASVEACAQVNARNPSIPATIAINYSPWHRVFPSDAPPTDFGPLHDEEVALFRTRMFTVRDLLATANANRGQAVEVAYLLLDSERFRVKRDDEEHSEAWNSAINEKYNVIYHIGKEVFPKATIEWWSRGTNDRFTLEEQGDTISTWIYSIPYADFTQQRMQYAYDVAQENGMSSFTTWVALGAGFDSTDWPNKHWEWNWDYDVAISWQTGARLNDPSYVADSEELAPWRAADPICFYPRPLDSGVPNWGKHFVAYVRGAHGIEVVP